MDSSSKTTTQSEAEDWQQAMKLAIRSASQLRAVVGVSAEHTEGEISSLHTGKEADFPVFVPLEFVELIEHGNASDPLLLQVLPVAEETVTRAQFIADPVGDLDALQTPGTLHKYQGRVLFITTSACGVHCRYCFRKEFPYSDNKTIGSNLDESLRYLAAHDEIEEVILSGGDPLTLTDSVLARLVEKIDAVPHVRRLRIHTRMPVVIPQRITESLVRILKASKCAIWFVIHANHPQELSDKVLQRLAKLIDHGIPVLNQSVLLRGVNDNVETLVSLSERLINHRIQPYYLHQLDKAVGTGHFEVSRTKGVQLVEKMRAQLPGYAVPEYVFEESGAPSKLSV